ncbi:IS3 family transposase [Paenibacillus sp. P96]|uniref:IS3 family transposase n=1 Tax=Paenibacillus zeirhizosphaerae TaxID=2987519 RepID=A0ABT9FXE2_9BACL|nr:IS3 family transposase [Paenibacillus sp. P96]MDP4099397.1 IS3 family transposase [Paenibacillus sp. P96]
MAKFSPDEKLQAVMRYQNGSESMGSIAKSIGLHHTVLLNWIRQYEYHGEEVFKKRYTSYSVQDKLDVLNHMKQYGTSIRETAAIFNIASHSTLLSWQRSLELHGIDALQPKKERRSSMKKDPEQLKDTKPVEALQKEVERLRMENAYPKKVECLSSKQGKITKQDKAQVVYELRNEFSVKALLQLADIPRSTYYYWVNTLNMPDKDSELKDMIQAIYEEHQGRYGYRRIQDELVNRGHRVNHKKVQRLMKVLGLKSLVRMKKYRSYKGSIGKVAPNILERNFHAEKPNEKWVTDITEFKLFGEKLYLSPMLDLYNGEIITYTIGSRPVYSLVSTMLDQSFHRLKDEDTPLIHSDQGWHYQMKQYRHTLKERGLKQSMSRKGNCYDNAVIENFFGILKSEFLYLMEFESIAHFKQELSIYIDYYNNKRIKAKLKGMSPVQYRTHAQQVA